MTYSRVGVVESAPVSVVVVVTLSETYYVGVTVAPVSAYTVVDSETAVFTTSTMGVASACCSTTGVVVAVASATEVSYCLVVSIDSAIISRTLAGTNSA